MTVIQENIEKWGAFLNVNLTADDYNAEVKKKLAEQQKKTVMKGFRPGMVPATLVKKMYGTPILIDVVNHIVSEQLEKHIKNGGLKVLGQPIPAESKENKADWENPADFSFWFEVAFIPKLDFDLTDIKATYYNIQADDETIDRQIENLKKRFASGVSDTFGASDISDVSGNSDALDVSGTPGVSGVSDNKEVALDADFFKKAYPDGSVNSEKEMREKIRTEIEQFYNYDADRTFSKNVFDSITEKTDTEIPKEFLLRWVEFHNEKGGVSKEEIEKNFDEYDKSLKKQLAESQIIKDEGIKIEKEDIRTFYKNDVLSRYYPVNSDDPTIKEQIEKITDDALADHKNVHQLYDMLLDKRMLVIFKEKVKQQREKITFNKFMEIAYGAATKATHSHEGHSHDNHDEHKH
jgi:trigger factor